MRPSTGVSSSSFLRAITIIQIEFTERRPRMAITNFIVTVLGVGAVVLLLRSDVKQSANVFKRNVRQIRTWLEEESNAVPKGGHAKPTEIDPHVQEKNVPKEDKP